MGENDVLETPGARQHKALPTGTALAASVVICTRDRPDTIGRAVESVASQSATSFDVLVVDQSRSNETQHIVQEYIQHYPHVRYLHLDRAGLSHAYNIGIKNTSGAVLAFTDDDCVAPPLWLAAITRCFYAQADVALIYGQVLSPTHMTGVGGGGVIPTLPIPERKWLNQRGGVQVFRL